jgi:hypothetical protein
VVEICALKIRKLERIVCFDANRLNGRSDSQLARLRNMEFRLHE